MDDEEEKTAGVVAYLSVRENPAGCICAIAIATKSIASKVRRQIVRYFNATVALASKSRDVGASPSSIIK